MRPQFGRRRLVDVGVVGDEAGVTGVVLVGRDDGVGDVGMGGECGFDLAQFDAVAADLDLVVDAAEELDLPVREALGEVAGAVEPGAWAGSGGG